MYCKTLGALIDGIQTDIVLSEFENTFFIILTQYQKIGSLLSVQREFFQNVEGNQEVYHIKTLLGEEDEYIHTVARYLTEQLNITKPAIFNVSLKKRDVQTLKAIETILKSNKTW